MRTTRNRFRSLALAGVLATGLLLTGCGDSEEKAAEKAVEKAIEDSATAGGEDVDVDIDGDDLSITNGDTSMQSGSKTQVPEGFPESFLPSGEYTLTMSTVDGDTSMLMAEVPGMDLAAERDNFVAALEAEGWTVSNKSDVDSDGVQMSTVSADNGTDEIAAMLQISDDGMEPSIVYTIQPKL